jgi:hypothetical protein
LADRDQSVVLSRFPDELSAVLLVGELNAAGIPAVVVGGLTAQMRAEAPGLVSVLVRLGDLERAQQLVADLAPPEGWEEEAETLPREDGMSDELEDAIEDAIEDEDEDEDEDEVEDDAGGPAAP